MIEAKTRQYGIDILKILATFMVVILHVNGFISDSFSFSEFSLASNIAWHVSEAIAYPAIHIFVMITAWFALERKFSTESIINVWLQTWVVCLLGIVLAMFLGLPIGIKELLESIVPFACRAYWYVTDYILLILLSPVLNINGIIVPTDFLNIWLESRL